MYTYLLDRRSMVLLVGGAAFAGFLLFVAGLFVGLSINKPQVVEAREFKGLAAFDAGLVASASAEPPSSRVTTGSTESESVATTAAPAEPPAANGEPSVPVESDASTTKAPAPESSRPAPAEPDVPAAAVIEDRPAPEPPRVAVPPVSREPSPPPQKRYAVQVGAYGLPENAERQLATVRAEGFAAEMVPLRTSAGRQLTTVRLTGYSSRAAAADAAARYRAGAPGREAIVKAIG